MVKMLNQGLWDQWGHKVQEGCLVHRDLQVFQVQEVNQDDRVRKEKWVHKENEDLKEIR